LLFVNDLCIIAALFGNFKLFDASIVLLGKSGGFIKLLLLAVVEQTSSSFVLKEVSGAFIDGKTNSLASFSKSTSKEPIIFLLLVEGISVDLEWVLLFVNINDMLRVLFGGDSVDPITALFSMLKLTSFALMGGSISDVFFDEACTTEEASDASAFFFSFEWL
jgi:hypothetical protein